MFDFQVDYRKLLCFLKDAISGDSLKSQSGADKNMRVVQSHSKHQQRYFLSAVCVCVGGV